MPKILLVDDEASILNVLKTLLTVEGFDPVAIQDGHKAEEAIRNEEFDLMISDIRMTPVSGMDLLKLSHEVKPGMSVIMVTAFGSVDTAVEAVRMGAYDYITKPFKIDELLITVKRALEYSKTMSENVDLRAQLESLNKFDDIIAHSDPMKQVCEMVQHIGPTNTSVLICGEKGTGKGLVAKAMHAYSGRKDSGEYVSIDCAGATEAELEAALFGQGGEIGAIEKSSGGTLFIADIEDMPLSMQKKFTSVLHDKQLQGEDGTVDVNLRVLASTSANLSQAVKGGMFEQDLYQRLSVIPIVVKPLRERREDILPLTAHILYEDLEEGAVQPTLDPAAREALMRYPWPENINELAAALKGALAAAPDNKVAIEALPEAIAKFAGGTSAVHQDQHKGESLKAFLRAKEKEYVQQVLRHTGGDKTKAAKALDISLATLYRKLPERKEGEGGEEETDSQS